MLFACRITKTTQTQYMYYVLLFHRNNGYVNAPIHIACLVMFLKSNINYVQPQGQSPLSQ